MRLSFTSFPDVWSKWTHWRAYDLAPSGRLKAIGNIIGVALENARLFETTERNLDRIRALREIDQAISSTLDMPTALKVLLEKIDLVFPYSAATVRLLEKEHGVLEPVACRNLDESEWKKAEWRGGRGIANVVFQTRTPLIIHDCQNDSRVLDMDSYRKHKLTSYVGTLACTGLEPRKLNAGEVQLLEAMADQIAVAIENSELYEQVRQNVRELQQKTEELERANKVKDEFLSVMSHELRTPLNVVAGYAGVLREGMLGQTNPEQGQALAKIMNRTNDLFGMITSMLYATSIVANEVRIESSPFDLGIFLEELKTFHKNRIQKAVALEWDYPAGLPVMTSDREKLRYLLQTLIDNAIKFTEKGRVILSVRVIENPTEHADGRPAEVSPAADRVLLTGRQWLEFKVADTGIGIADEKLPVIFEKFRQADGSETRLYGGVGLGLYIAKNFTELLGGQIDVETGKGVGSVFTVTIPCTIVPATPETGRARTPREPERKDRPDVSLIRTERI